MSPNAKVSENKRAYQLFGHRGAAGLVAENTLGSIEHALMLGADGVEIDVHVCKSGELIVIHDETVDRTTDGSGVVKDMTWQEISKLRTENNESVPRLEQVIESLEGRGKLLVELKPQGTALPLVDCIQSSPTLREWAAENMLVTSYNYPELLSFSRQCPEVQVVIPLAYVPLSFPDLSQFQNIAGIMLIAGDGCCMTEEMVNHVRNSGHKLFIYAMVNNPHQIKYVTSFDPYAIITNYPDLY